MRTEHAARLLKERIPADDAATHTHPQRRGWPWLVAAVALCPCHLPILLAIAGTGVVGGALARNAVVVLLALTVAFAFAVWRYMGTTGGHEACPACIEERRRAR